MIEEDSLKLTDDNYYFIQNGGWDEVTGTLQILALCEECHHYEWIEFDSLLRYTCGCRIKQDNK